jgi:hypothetical protein
MDWESLYCPDRHCRYYGIPFYQGLMVKNGSSHGQKQALCRACGSSVSMRYGTAYLGLEADPAIFETAVRALAEGNSLRATGRIVQIDKDTACDWLDRAAHHCRLVMLYLWRDLHVTDDHIPFFTSDQLPEYRTALLHAYGTWYQPQRRGDRGRYPKPRRVPLPSLLYAQVVKRREKGRVVEVGSKVVFGDPDTIAARLATSPVSNTVNISFVERDNLTQRQSNRRLTRRTNGFSKEITWFEKQLWVSLAYYHLVLPHHSLRQRLPTPEPTRGIGSPRRWRPVTPAMAAGVTNHVWTTTELLSYRVPAQFLDQLPETERLFPPLDQSHQGS